MYALVWPLILMAGVAGGETRQAQAPGEPHYEVTSVKPNRSDDLTNRDDIRAAGTLFTATNTTVKALIEMVYDTKSYDLPGAPTWLSSERFDIAARADDRAAGRPNHVAMLKRLLADRFSLRMHTETRIVDGRELARLHRDRLGPALKPSVCESAGSNECRDRPSIRGGLLAFDFQGKTMAFLARWLEKALKKPVYDGTGLTGRYDFSIAMRAVDAPGLAEGMERNLAVLGAGSERAQESPSLTTTLKELFGLTLESKRIPVSVWLIDDVKRPEPN